MENRERVQLNDEPRQARNTPHPRAVGAPLPRGGSRWPLHSSEPGPAAAAPAPGHALAGPAAPAPAEEHADHSSSVQRVANALRGVVPFVQRLLPLLDGNFVTAASNILAPQPKPAPPVNLAPIHEGMNELQIQQRQLQELVADQHASLKQVEDRLELVREATDRNTLEQQELMEDLKAVGHKVNVVAFAALALLAVSVALNLFLYLRIERILP